MADEQYESNLTGEIKTNFENYLNNRRSYFIRPDYNQDALDLLYLAVNNFYTVIANDWFNAKKSLLEYQASLLPLVQEAELV